jgi:hypothetical protein
VSTEKQVLYFTPGLPEEFRSRLWGRYCATIEEALSAALASLPETAKVAVIPEGPYVLARVAEMAAA